MAPKRRDAGIDNVFEGAREREIRGLPKAGRQMKKEKASAKVLSIPASVEERSVCAEA